MANRDKPLANEIASATGVTLAATLVPVVTTQPAAPVEAKGGTYRYRDPEKRKAYMREYMAKKRGGSHPAGTPVSEI